MILSLALAQPSEQDTAFNTSLPSDGLRAFGVSHGMDQGAGPGQRRPPTTAASPKTVTDAGVGGGWGCRNGSPQRLPPLSRLLPLLLSIIQGACSKEFSTRVLVIYLDSAHPACPDPVRLTGDRTPPNPRPLIPGPWGQFHL